MKTEDTKKVLQPTKAMQDSSTTYLNSRQQNYDTYSHVNKDNFPMKICNLKELSLCLGCSPNHIYKLISLGMPYHQLSKNSRRYYLLSEVIEWLSSAGLKKTVTWR